MFYPGTLILIGLPYKFRYQGRLAESCVAPLSCAPRTSRLKSHSPKVNILITSPQLPMQRAGKGIVRRARPMGICKGVLDGFDARNVDALTDTETSYNV